MDTHTNHMGKEKNQGQMLQDILAKPHEQLEFQREKVAEGEGGNLV